MVIFQGEYSEEIKCIYKKALTRFYILCLTAAMPLVIAIGIAVGYFLKMWYAPILLVGIYSIPYIVVAIYMHIKGVDEVERNMPSKIVFNFEAETLNIYSRGKFEDYRSIPFAKIKKLVSADNYLRYRYVICQKDHVEQDDLEKIQEYFADVIKHKN